MGGPAEAVRQEEEVFVPAKKQVEYPSNLIVCRPKRLPKEKWVAAAAKAREINPLNNAPLERLAQALPRFAPTAEHLALVTTKYWGAAGVRLTVGFLDSPPAALRKRILTHMNAWSKTANVKFVEARTDPQVRIARMGGVDGGYWSYLGTEVLMIPKDQPTMNLEAFSMSTPEAEYHRVVRHETGHTLGFPHEHMRKELVDLIDAKKAIVYFGQTQGWSAQEVRQQVLTPLEESSLMHTPHADPNSIMCYQIPGEITKNGKPIVGGLDIDTLDYAFAGQVYPKGKGKAPKSPEKKSRSAVSGR
jgi:hypothetical protein